LGSTILSVALHVSAAKRESRASVAPGEEIAGMA
jgi:hypothetical protein